MGKDKSQYALIEKAKRQAQRQAMTDGIPMAVLQVGNDLQARPLHKAQHACCVHHGAQILASYYPEEV